MALRTAPVSSISLAPGSQDPEKRLDHPLWVFSIFISGEPFDSGDTVGSEHPVPQAILVDSELMVRSINLEYAPPPALSVQHQKIRHGGHPTVIQRKPAQ
jgi:hypothetical protein